MGEDVWHIRDSDASIGSVCEVRDLGNFERPEYPAQCRNSPEYPGMMQGSHGVCATIYRQYSGDLPGIVGGCDVPRGAMGFRA